MSLKSSEENYKISKSLYADITDDFYEIENNSEEDDGYLIDQTLNDIKKLNRYISKINIEELEEGYEDNIIEILSGNIDAWKEDVYYIERALMSMKLFDKVHPVLPKYIKKVNWGLIANSEDQAIQKFGRFITNESNYEQFKSVIWNIIKGTMSVAQFKKIFDNISGRITKPSKASSRQEYKAIPPEMWSEEKRKGWDEQTKRGIEQSVKDKKSEFDEIGEHFIALEKYKKSRYDI